MIRFIQRIFLFINRDIFWQIWKYTIREDFVNIACFIVKSNIDYLANLVDISLANRFLHSFYAFHTLL